MLSNDGPANSLTGALQRLGEPGRVIANCKPPVANEVELLVHPAVTSRYPKVNPNGIEVLDFSDR